MRIPIRVNFLKIAFIFFIFETSVIFAQQRQVSHQSLYWLRYYNQLNLNDKLIWHNEIENRRFINPHVQHHFITHSRLHFLPKKFLEIAAGLTYSLQSPQDPTSISRLAVPEIRPNQEIQFKNEVAKRFIIQQRIRIDERFIRKNNGQELLKGYGFNVRLRYRIMMNIKLSKLSKDNCTILKIGNEVMLNINKNISANYFDQNRLLLSLERSLSKNFSLEMGYIHWFQQRSNTTEFFRREIFRLTIFHKIKK